MPFRYLKNQKGFSLVQVLVAFGLLGVLSVVMMGMFEQQNKLSKRVKVDGELNEVRTLFLNVLNDKIACEANLQFMKKGDLINYFKIDDGEPFAAVGEQFKNLGIKVISMQILTDETVLSTGQSPQLVRPEDGQTTIVFRIVFQKIGQVIGGKDIAKDFNVRVVLGEHKWEAGPTPAAVKEACISNGAFKIADATYLAKDSYQPPNVGDEPVKCTGMFCLVDCVKFDGVPAKQQILKCVTPGT